MSAVVLPAPLSRLDATWFDEALPSRGRARVVDVACESLPVSGAVGELARVRLSYGDGEPGPASVIAKFRGTSENQRAMDAALGIYDRERHFYAEVAASVPVASPRCFFAGDGHRTPLLLEDLAGLRVVDQVLGLRLADAERLMDTLAGLHARFWGRPLPTGSDWAVSLTDPMFAGMLTQLLGSGVSTLRERYADRVEPGMLVALETNAPHWSSVLARCDEGPRTLVHNDCRADNIFFTAEDEPVLIDWQIPAHSRGTQDVAYLLSGSLDPRLLSTSWEALLRRYHQRLAVPDYSWDQCLTHYRQSLLYTLTPGVAMLGAMAIAGDDRGLAESMVLRTVAHAAELDAFSTL
ncbi:phosphotransferase [Pseudonocardia spinosispora]|uniref:phosphotransferase n=1 Tax=Pseudonocardia spinosispora TaxID=103441 RepID=UPI00042333FB|nr:phosphotransferase [Pseudonocardia spinosispora]